MRSKTSRFASLSFFVLAAKGPTFITLPLFSLMKIANPMFPYRSLVLTMGIVPGVLSAVLSDSDWTCRFVVGEDILLRAILSLPCSLSLHFSCGLPHFCVAWCRAYSFLSAQSSSVISIRPSLFQSMHCPPVDHPASSWVEELPTRNIFTDIMKAAPTLFHRPFPIYVSHLQNAQHHCTQSMLLEYCTKHLHHFPQPMILYDFVTYTFIQNTQNCEAKSECKDDTLVCPSTVFIPAPFFYYYKWSQWACSPEDAWSLFWKWPLLLWLYWEKKRPQFATSIVKIRKRVKTWWVANKMMTNMNTQYLYASTSTSTSTSKDKTGKYNHNYK